MKKDNLSNKDLLAKAISIAALVDYQGGTVVSRTIIDRNTGTVTLFAVDKGQGLSEHTVPYDALVHVIDGEAIVTISSQNKPIKTGEAIIMPANKPHALKAVDRFKMMLVMIRDV